jgi:hypothetical protein
MDNTGKATEEVAKTIGKGIDASRDLGGFVARFITAPLDEIAGKWTDDLKFKRWENQLALHEKAKRKLKELGGVDAVQWREVPMRLQVPLLEAASITEEDDIRERWANLLLNFANEESGISMERSFISVLRELSPLEAVILDRIYATKRTDSEGVLTAGLPDTAERETPGRGVADDPSPEIAFAVSNLIRLGCLISAAVWGGSENIKVVLETTFGRELMRACTLQKST